MQGVTANGFSVRTAPDSDDKYDPVIFALYTTILDSDSDVPSWFKVLGFFLVRSTATENEILKQTRH
jgi:hypothetical protein